MTGGYCGLNFTPKYEGTKNLVFSDIFKPLASPSCFHHIISGFETIIPRALFVSFSIFLFRKLRGCVIILICRQKHLLLAEVSRVLSQEVGDSEMSR